MKERFYIDSGVSLSSLLEATIMSMKETTTTAIRPIINIIHLFSYSIIGNGGLKLRGMRGRNEKTVPAGNRTFKGSMMVLWFFFLFWGFFPLNAFCDGIPRERQIALRLTGAGFENVKVLSKEGRLIIACENKDFRFDIEAMREVFKIAGSLLDGESRVVYVVKEKNIPAAVIEAGAAECRNYAGGVISGKEFASCLKPSLGVNDIIKDLAAVENTNASFAKVDISLKPGLNFQFGPYTQPVMYQANLLAEFQTGLWSGMSISYELVVPVKNDFGPRYDSLRTGMAVLNQMFTLPGSTFVSVSGGVFTQNRFGGDLEIRKYFMDGNMSVSLNAGYTGYVSFSGFEKIYYSKDFLFTGSVGIDYRFADYDLTIGVAAGRYLMGDESIRMEINREFGEVEIGFFAVRSKDGINNGGINVAVPLFPSRSITRGIIKLKAADKFNTSYAVKSNTFDLVGLRYNTGHRIASMLKNYVPAYIKNNF